MMYKCKQCGKIFQTERNNEIISVDGRLFHEKCETPLEPIIPENTKQSISSGSSGTVINDNSKTDSSVAYGSNNTTNSHNVTNTTKVENVVVHQHGIEEQMVETKQGTIRAQDCRVCSECKERVYYKLYDELSGLCKNCIDKTRIEQAKSLFEEEQYEEAITELQNTNRNGYLLPEAMYWIGRCKMKLGNTDEAIKWFAKSKNDVPKSLYYLGVINQDRGNIEKAKDYYYKALETNDEKAKDAAQKKINELKAAEKAKQEQIAKAKAEQERIAKQKAEQERLAKEQVIKEQQAKEKAERERIAKETYQQCLNRYESFDEKHFYTTGYGELVSTSPYESIEKDINPLYDDIKKQIDNPKEEDKKYIQEYKILLVNLLKRKDLIAEKKYRFYKNHYYNICGRFGSFDYCSIETIDGCCNTIKREMINPDNKKYIREYQQLLNSLLKGKEILIQKKAEKEQNDIICEESDRELCSWWLTAVFPFILILAIPIMELGELLFFSHSYTEYHFYAFLIRPFLDVFSISGTLIFVYLMIAFLDKVEYIVDKITESKIFKLLYKMSDNIVYSTGFISYNSICKWIVFAITSFTTTIISWNIYNFVIEQIESNRYMRMLPYMFQGFLETLLFALFVHFLVTSFIHQDPVRNSHVKEKMPKTLGQALTMYTISVTSYFAVLLCIFGIWYIILACFI